MNDIKVDVSQHGVRAARLYCAGTIVFLLFGISCQPEDVDAVGAQWTVSTPQALSLDCAQIPTDLSAELWVSGNQSSCPMTVDIDNGTTSGTCQTVAGRIRTVTLDWFVMRDSPFDGTEVRVLLAQARGEVNLENTSETDASWSYTEDDIRITECLDMTNDAFEGETQVELNGQVRSVCDLDSSCGSTQAAGCSNLGEICIGEDPLSDP